MTRARFVLCGALLGCAGPSADGLDRARLPESVKSDYDVFAHRCSKCHTLARPLQSGITDDEFWSEYVARMRRMPGSGINEDDAQRVLRFLRWYSAASRAQEGAP
jgi:hypothetical protein